jgi:peptidoglycan/LPS O-acetylase OafA/YrhL
MTTPHLDTHLNSRRYDLDWLRIIAFGLLIFYHIGMFYVTWGWHVKSMYAGPLLEPAMRLLSPWRLALLFFISGLALRFAADKATLGTFAWQRTLRLFIPIIFGIFVIVAPQSYLQLVESGEIHMRFGQFYPEYIKGNISSYSVIIPTWNHLWYVVYLMFYTLLLLPLARPIAKFMQGRGAVISRTLFQNRFGPLAIMIVPALPFLCYRLVLDPAFPTTHDLVNDWANHAHSFTIMLMGFVLAKDKYFWRAIHQAFKPALLTVFVLGSALSMIWLNWEMVEQHEAWLWPARFGRIFYAWLCIVAMLGAAQKWLNRPSRALSYMTEAIFPWYILHQTLIIMAGFWLTRQGLKVGMEFFLLVLATFAGCALSHELIIRRWRWIRPLFGLKPTSTI